MKSATKSVSAAAMLTLALIIARIASPPGAGAHRLGPASAPCLAPAPANVGPADDGSGDGDDGDEDGGDDSGY